MQHDLSSLSETPRENMDIENEQTRSLINIHTLTRQHAQQSYSIKAGEQTHHQVTHYEYQRLNSQSCFYQTRLDFLSPFSHSRSRQSGTTLLTMLGIALIVFLADDGMTQLAHHLDKKYQSDGAPPSLTQQHKNYAHAQTITGWSTFSIAVFFILIALLIYFFVDRLRYMRGYRDFTLPLGIPTYEKLPKKFFFDEINAHVQFLMQKHFNLGIPAIAHLLTSLQENLIDTEDDSPHTPLTVQQHSQLSTSDRSLFETTPPPTLLDQTSPSSSADFFHHLSEKISEEARNVKEIRKQREENQHIIDRNQINVVIGNQRILRRIEALENFIRKLNLSEKTVFRNAYEKQKNLKKIEEESLVDKHNFIPLLVFKLRKKMSLAEMCINCTGRAKFLKTLLAEPYYKNHSTSLSVILYVFFSLYSNNENAFDAEKRMDEKTFLALSQSEQTQVLSSLQQHGELGIEIAETLWKAKTLSKKTKTKLFNQLLKKQGNENLIAHLITQQESGLALSSDDQGNLFNALSYP